MLQFVDVLKQIMDDSFKHVMIDTVSITIFD